MSEERRSIALSDAELDGIIELIDRELALVKPMIDLAAKLRAAKLGERPTPQPAVGERHQR